MCECTTGELDPSGLSGGLNAVSAFSLFLFSVGAAWVIMPEAPRKMTLAGALSVPWLVSVFVCSTVSFPSILPVSLGCHQKIHKLC